ncbi:MAG: histidinol dehydrogenase [Deltaproteobacteria bacterium]|nr:histidinol dehydrogenase [Deltaproteobacteria bacterium]
MREAASDPETTAAVARILDAVRREGRTAVARLTREHDRVDVPPHGMRLSAEVLARAHAQVAREQPALLTALREMAARIRRFAEAQRQALADVELALPGGGTVGERWVPIERVGVYVPGGRAFYPSTLAMTVIPAQVAGATRIVGVTPPRAQPTLEGAFGIDPLVLATAQELGLDELYACGGAQGVGFLAYDVPQVDLVAGPGNRFVAEAKRQLIGQCGIDSVAGPTEVLILADASADPAWLAEDLLAQAEHDPDAAAVLIADDRALLDAVAARLAERVAASPRKEILAQSLARHGRLFRANRDDAIAFAQAWAPEHLELVVREPAEWVPRLTNAGALFVGAWSAEAFGDYGAGPNHVLPTARTARFASPLGVASLMKRQSVLRLAEADARALADGVGTLADAERLPHHAESARLRGRR